MVQDHQFREDIYIEHVLTPHDKVRKLDREEVRRILVKELERNRNH
ncbi:MAG: hypothetical protein GF317_12880 [Candidatus Lokiarchaeota archaeon]|nr:hypothetical protein [Candidatus Lokiarchaeota archaeon]MBD3200535.1 hypothetical protein [Candidatus Lokiarchaeota archaeon]